MSDPVPHDGGGGLPRPERWYHSFDLPGEPIRGDRPLWLLRQEADLVFSHGVEGRSVLDIGAWDGFFSFEAERRGARSVLATDHFCWSGPGWGSRLGFDHVHERLGSAVRSLDVDIPDLSPMVHGSFDLVLLLGVLYHVKDPFRCLETAASMCLDHLVVETETALEHEPCPAMRLYREGELFGDPTNIWAPNSAALRVLLARFGFGRIEIHESPGFVSEAAARRTLRARIGRGLVRLGLRSPLPRADRRRVLIHAWR